MNPLYETMSVSVFERMSLAAAKHDAVNLGQGFPDFGWPDPVLEKAATALAGNNQYAPSRGLPVLRRAIADHYQRHFGQDLHPDHVTVTSGATEALGAAILATVTPGEEVIIFAPAFDSYAPMVRRAGGTPVEVKLVAPDFALDATAIAHAITDKTRAIILTNPHNPTGRLYGETELQLIADIAVAHDLIVISDEVWEHLLLDGQRFVPMATLPGMAERTIKTGSAGKIFSLTGWKIGWFVADPVLGDVVARAHQFLTFSSARNLQEAVAYGLGRDEWIAPMQDRFTRARDRLINGLERAAYAVIRPEATYFLAVDLAASGIDIDDESFAMRAVEDAGVAVVPMSAFTEVDPETHLLRLCFAKQDATIDAGIDAMAKARELLT
ncbi:MAG: aminotransferase class I/II-fold pyridoxal phosphate-dependent enzyme [Sphingomonas sp.]|nr:aminotransferase class I/II-fold pyridoxal phosphate-dependent enzyme [Sphingomonas sp.]